MLTARTRTGRATRRAYPDRSMVADAHGDRAHGRRMTGACLLWTVRVVFALGAPGLCICCVVCVACFLARVRLRPLRCTMCVLDWRAGTLDRMLHTLLLELLVFALVPSTFIFIFISPSPPPLLSPSRTERYPIPPTPLGPVTLYYIYPCLLALALVFFLPLVGCYLISAGVLGCAG